MQVTIDEHGLLAERVHVAVTTTAPDLAPKTWYGMPAYANEDGKVVIFFQDSGKCNSRYSTLGFQDAATLDDRDLWPLSYALDKGPGRWRRRSSNWWRPRSPDRPQPTTSGAPFDLSGDEPTSPNAEYDTAA